MINRVSDQPDASDTRPIALGASPSNDAHAASSADLGLGGEDAPAEASVPFPIVGIGASAGGLEAVTQLLRALPIDTGSGFVIIQHLAPDHASNLAEILTRATTMSVCEVRDEPEVEPNCVYVIPPGRTMIIAGGKDHCRRQVATAAPESLRPTARHRPVLHLTGGGLRTQGDRRGALRCYE